MGKKLRCAGVPFQILLVLLLLSDGLQISSSHGAEPPISQDVHTSGRISAPPTRSLTEDKLLIEAAEIGDMEGVKNALLQGASLDTESVSGLKPIQIASKNGHLEIVQLLTDQNGKINVKVDWERVMDQGTSPLRSLLQFEIAEAIDSAETNVDPQLDFLQTEGDLDGDSDAAPNDQLDENGPATEDVDSSTILTTMRFTALDFDEVSMDDDLRVSLETAVVSAIAAAAKVAVDSVGIVDLRPGSVIMDVQISFPEGMDPIEQEALLDLLTNNPDAVFSGPEFVEQFGVPEVLVSSAVASMLAPGAEGVGFPDIEDLLDVEDVLVSKGAATPAEEESEIDDADLIEKLMVPEEEETIADVFAIDEAPAPEEDVEDTAVAEALEAALLAPVEEPDEEIEIELELGIETRVGEGSISPAVEPPPEKDDLVDEDVSVDTEIAPVDEVVVPVEEPPIPVIARAPDDNVVTAELRFPDLDFVEVAGNEEVRNRLEAAIISDLADAAGVDESSVRILDIREGSVIVDAEIALPEGRDPAIADELVQTLELEPEDVFSPDFQLDFGVPEVTVARKEELVIRVPTTEAEGAPVDELVELDLQPEVPLVDVEAPITEESVAEDADLIEISRPPTPESEIAVEVPETEPDDEISELILEEVSPAIEAGPVSEPVSEDVDLDTGVLDEIEFGPSPSIESAISPEPEMEESTISTLEDVEPATEDVVDLDTSFAPGPEPEEISPVEMEAGEVVAAQLRFANLDFNEVTGDEELEARLRGAVISDLADAAGVDESMVRILNITEGSVIVDAEITFPQGRDPAIAEELVQMLQFEPEDVFSPDLQQEFGLPEVTATSQPAAVSISPDEVATLGVPLAEPADEIRELVETDDEIPAAEGPVPEAPVVAQLPEDADLEDVLVREAPAVEEPIQESADVAAPALEIEISLAPGPEDEPEIDLDAEQISPVAEVDNVITAQLRFPDLDYEAVTADEGLMARFRAGVITDLADAAGVDPSSVRILGIRPGSVLVDAEITFPSSEDAGVVSEEFVQNLQLEPDEVFTLDFQEEFGLPEVTVIIAPTVVETIPQPGVEPEEEQIEIIAVVEPPVEEPPIEDLDLEVDGDVVDITGIAPAPEIEMVEELEFAPSPEIEEIVLEPAIEEVLEEGLEIEAPPSPEIVDELADKIEEIEKIVPAPLPDTEEELLLEEELPFEEIETITEPAPEVEVDDLGEEEILELIPILGEISAPIPELEEDLDEALVLDFVPAPEAEADDDLLVDVGEAPVPEPEEDFIDEILVEEPAPVPEPEEDSMDEVLADELAPEEDIDIGLGVEEAPTPEAEDVVLALRFTDLDFDNVTGDPQSRADLEAAVKASIAAATGVDIDSINILGIRSGSVIVDTAIVLKGEDVDQVVGAVNSSLDSAFASSQFGVPEVTVTRRPSSSRAAPTPQLSDTPAVIEPAPVQDDEIETSVTPSEEVFAPIDEVISVPFMEAPTGEAVGLETDIVPEIEPEAEPGVEAELDMGLDAQPQPEPDVEGRLAVTPQLEVESIEGISPEPEVEEVDEFVPTPETLGLPSAEGVAVLSKIVASVKVDIDFNVVMSDPSLRNALEEGITLEMAELAGVDESAVKVVDIREGSVIVDTEVTLPEDFPPEQTDAILGELSAEEALFSDDFRNTFGSVSSESAELMQVEAELPVEVQEIPEEEVVTSPTPEVEIILALTPEPEMISAPLVEGVDPGPPEGVDGVELPAVEEAKSPQEVLEEEVDIVIKKSWSQKNGSTAIALLICIAAAAFQMGHL